MEKVESFKLDHNKVKAPYVRKCCVLDGKIGDKVSKFDLRFLQPNVEAFGTASMHGLEHLLATYLREELFLYRQHEKNVSVHLKKNIFSYIKQVLKNRDTPVVYAPSYYSIDIFYNKFMDKMTDNKKNCFKKYLELKNKNFFYRFWSILCSPFVLGKNGKIKLLIKILFRPYWKDNYE